MFFFFFFASRPKMADVPAPFCASPVAFSGRRILALMFNHRQLAEAIFADICLCTGVEEAAASLHKDCPLEGAHFFFLAKRK